MTVSEASTKCQTPRTSFFAGDTEQPTADAAPEARGQWTLVPQLPVPQFPDLSSGDDKLTS